MSKVFVALRPEEYRDLMRLLRESKTQRPASLPPARTPQVDFSMYYDYGIVYRNVTEEEIPANCIMQVRGVHLDDGRWACDVEKPDGTSQPFFITSESRPCPVGQRLTGYIHEKRMLKYQLSEGTPAKGERWGAKSGSWLLHRDPAGPFVAIGGQAENGQAGFVQASVTDIHLAKATANIAKNTAGTLQVLVGTPGSETPSGVTITAYNHFNAVSANDVVLIVKAGGNWYIAGGGGSDGKVKMFSSSNPEFLSYWIDTDNPAEISSFDQLPLRMMLSPTTGKVQAYLSGSDIAGYASGVDQVLVKTSLNSWAFVTLSQCTPI